MLIAPEFYTDIVGLAIFALVLFAQRASRRYEVDNPEDAPAATKGEK